MKKDKYNKYVSKAKAMEKTGLSRRAFDKAVQDKCLTCKMHQGKKEFSSDEIIKYMKTKEYKEAINGKVDKRNKLNDLTGKEWLPETKSFFYQKGLGADSEDAKIEKLHPAPYSFQDVEHLITFFTKRNMKVLDPFGGVGSTAKACERSGRICTSIELSKEFHKLSILRLEKEVGKGTSKKHIFINADSCVQLPKLNSNYYDFMITSPPYWGILNKLDQKVKKNRVDKNLKTNYSNSNKDLGNIKNYEEFLKILVNKIFLECARTLKRDKYMAIIVSDFRDKSKYISFHSDLIHMLNGKKIPNGGVLTLQGTKILLQNHKSLLPYGYPFAYVENIHHQYVLLFRKDKK